MLKTFHLNGCQINDDSLVAVTQREWPNLEILGLFYNSPTAIGIKKLVAKDWIHLRILLIGNPQTYSTDNNIGSYSAKFLTKINMPVLKELFIFRYNIGIEGTKYSSKGRWKNIERLFMNRYIIIKLTITLVSMDIQLPQKEIGMSQQNQKTEINMHLRSLSVFQLCLRVNHGRFSNLIGQKTRA